jgi:hypothetical protein
VPATAPAAVLFSIASWGESPICCSAQRLHDASSCLKSSNGFPAAGATMTLGPVGTVAQADKARKEIEKQNL